MASAIQDFKLQVDGSNQVTAGVFKIKAQNDVNIGTGGSTARPATIVEGIELLRSLLRIEYKTVGSRIARLPWVDQDPLEDFYVDLQLQTKNRSGKYVDKNNLRFEDIFSGNPTRVFLVAKAGYGKSTMLTKIAQAWATDECSPFKHFQTVVLLRLRDMKKGESCHEFLCRFCHSRLSHDFPELDLSTFLRDELRKSLVLLDGYDELSCEGQSSVEAFLDTNPPVFRGTVLMSSRPRAQASIFKFFARVIAIPELSITTQEKLINRTFPRNSKKADEVKLFVKRRLKSYQTGMYPLLLYAICFVVEHSDSDEVNSTEGLLYVVIKILVRRTAERLCFCIEENVIENIVLSLGELFYIRLLERKIEVTNSDLEDVCGNNYQIVKNMEIFSNVENGEIDIIHCLLMEIFVVRYLNDSFSKLERIEDTRHFLLNFLGDRNFVGPFLRCLPTPALVLTGKHDGIMYLVENNHSILNGRFILSNFFYCQLVESYLARRFSNMYSSPFYLVVRCFRLLKAIYEMFSNWKQNLLEFNTVISSAKRFGQIEIRIVNKIKFIFLIHKVLNFSSVVDELYKTEEQRNWIAMFEEVGPPNFQYEMEVKILH